MKRLPTRLARYVLLGGFSIILLGPLTGTVFQLDPGQTPAEKRKLSRFPSNELLCEKGFPAWRDGFESFLNDHFGFRKTLITGHNLLLYQVFSVSGAERVTVGTDGWLFYSSAVRDLLHQKPFRADRLEQYATIFQRRKNWLAQQGIGYAVVFAPSKATMYPQHLPGWPEGDGPGKRNMLALQAHLKQRGIPLADLHGAMSQVAKQDRLYHKTDTHWNDLGAFVAYQATCPTIDVAPMSRKHTTVRQQSGACGDLGRMLNLGFLLKEDHITVVLPPAKKPKLTKEKIPPYKKVDVFENPTAPPGTLIVFGDSFSHGTKYGLFLATHFQRTIIIRDKTGTFDTALIKRERPSMVLQETVERYLANPRNWPNDGL
ncbi:MAG: hypothetical protein JRF33_03225 [Deltaproteobacteria bacterium]|nr:hypothetical protein [Deltaproteobacteria bacterium]